MQTEVFVGGIDRKGVLNFEAVHNNFKKNIAVAQSR